MNRPRSAATSVSLFPFLAVLVCAMGALIFLLVVITPRIRKDVLTRAERERKPRQIAVEAPVPTVPHDTQRIPNTQPLHPEERWHALIADLLNRQASWRQTVAKRQTRLQAVQQQIAQTQADVEHVELKRQALEQQERQFVEEEQRLTSDQSDTDRLIAEINRRIQDVRRHNARADSKYAFIPFDGPTGTVRRPIFIECTDQGLRFVPEDILLTADDLEGFTPGFNPLLAGVRGLMSYWSQTDRLNAHGGRFPKPYVLMIVRPSGSLSFYAARALLAELDEPFGYELIEADWKLDLPDPDVTAQAVCQRAVDRLLQERKRARDVLVVGRTPAGRTVRFRRGVGFEVEEAEDPDGGDGVRAGAPARASGGEEFGDHTDGAGDFSTNTSSTALVEKPSEPERQQGPLSPDPSPSSERRGSSSLPVAGADGTKSGRPTGAVRAGAPATASQRSGTGGMGTQSDKHGVRVYHFGTDGPIDATHSYQFAGDGSRGRSTQLPQNGSDGWLGSNEVSPQPDAQARELGAPLRSDPNHPTGARSDLGVGGGTGEAEIDGLADKTTSSPGSPATDSRSGPFENGDDSSGGPGARPGAETPQRPGGIRNDSGHDGRVARPDRREGRGSATFETATPFEDSGRATRPEVTFPQFGGIGAGSGASAASEPSAGSVPLPSVSFGQRSGGKRFRWGYSDPGAMIGFERAVDIRVFADRVLVGKERPIPVGRGETRDALLEQVLTALNEHVKSWGKPPKNFYWVPAVRFVVSPGGNQHYERLHGPLARWGLASTVDFTLNTER